MAEYRAIAAVSDVPNNSGAVFEVDDNEVAVFNVEGVFYAIDNTCLHRGGPLGEGELQGTTVSCPWHGWEYDVTTGETSMSPGECVKCYEVKVEEDKILIAV